MKLKVFKQSAKDKTVRLELRRDYGGNIGVFAVDYEGSVVFQGRLMTFNVDGTVKMAAGVNSRLGFILDSEGRIVLEGEK